LGFWRDDFSFGRGTGSEGNDEDNKNEASKK